MEEGTVKKDQGVNSSSLLMGVSTNCLLAFLLTFHCPTFGHIVVINCQVGWEIESVVPT